MSIRSFFAAALAAFFLSGVPAVAAGPRASDIVAVDLLVEPDAVKAGELFTVGIRLNAKPHWHTYWRNPGDSGLATEIAWTLPPGFAAGPIRWPVPDRIAVGGIVNYGYEGSTTLLVDITPPAALPAGQPVALAADVSFLVCERECIPGDAKVAGRADVAGPGETTRITAEARQVFEAARARLPIPMTWPVTASNAGDETVLRIGATELQAGRIVGGYFFPYTDGVVDHAAAQTVSAGPDGIVVTAAKPPPGSTAAGPPGGLLVIEERLDGVTARSAFAVGPEPGVTATMSTAPSPADLSPAAIGWAALLAFAGGLVLNLMPCVFPVLSIKVLSLVRHSGLSPRAVRLSGVAYAAGVVLSFLALAGLLLAVRAGGAELGWGFQLQSPALVGALACLLLAMGLSLSGAVEFGTSFGRLGGVGSGDGLLPSFLTGVLATVVATPCTAPFMGAAVGYAVVAPVPVALAVFAALGLGMAAPFLLLTVRPSLVASLPRPGAWMNNLKQVLAFPVYATAAWLVFVLSRQVGPEGLAAALAGLVLTGFLVWTLRIANESGSVGRRVALGAGTAALAALVALGVLLARGGGVPQPSVEFASVAGGSEPYSQARLEGLRGEKRPVFVDLTAAWCLTCLVNERTSLSSAAVRDGFRARGVVYLKGDWTNQNPEITRLLERNGRSGVPLYLLYPPAGEPVVLPQILTESTMLDALSALPTGQRAEGPQADPRSPTASGGVL